MDDERYERPLKLSTKTGLSLSLLADMPKDLIRNKVASGREQDLLDAKNLRAAEGGKKD